jgi:hypothetical protein
MEPLKGTLEIAYLKEPYKGDVALGTILRNGEDIAITHAHNYLDRGISPVLVRTDTDPTPKNSHETNSRRGLQTGNFISTTIPSEVNEKGGLFPDDYLLTGVLPWEGFWPSLNDVNRIFDPGRMGLLVYLGIHDAPGMLISGRGNVAEILNYRVAVSRQIRGDPINHALTILVGSESQISELENVIMEDELIPIRMEPFQRT